MNARAFISVAVSLLLTLAAAGCGGGDSTSSLTRAEFIKQADAICRKADEVQIAVLVKTEKETPGDDHKNPAMEKNLVIKGLEPIQKEAEEIDALGSPSGDEEQIAAIVEGIEAGVKSIEEDPSVLEGAFTQVDKLSASYGLKDCSDAL